MALARIFRPENRLAAIFGTLRDPTVEELESSAQTNLDGMRDRIRAFAIEQLKVVSTLADEPEEVIFAECRTMSNAALAISEVAGAAGLEDLGGAALGLHIMIDALFTQGIWHTDALRLHVETLAMLAANPDLSQTEASKVLNQMQMMRNLIGVVE